MTPTPETFPERILLAVTGLSPQIVTETLYALCVTRTPPFIPTRIHLLTTVEGASRAELTLLHPHQGKFMRFCEDYGLIGKIHFDLSCIEIIHNVDGEPLPDIRTPEENASAANTISACVQRITADPKTALHVSIAGGRKTMGFYLGYALSLFSRSQDRLSHVLVPEPFESNHNFYYPPPTPEVMFTNTNKPVSTSEANIMLAEIPFVRLRHGLPEELLASVVDFSQAVEAAQQNLAPPRVEISFNPARLVCGGREVFLSPQIFSFYAWLAKLRKEGIDAGATRYNEADPAVFLNIYRLVICEMSHDYETTLMLMKDGMPEEFFEEKKSRVNRALKKALGNAARPYLIQVQGKRPRTLFSVGLNRDEINFV